jgi:hypothetical protein
MTDNTEFPRKIQLNDTVYVRADRILTVIPPIMHTNLSEPRYVNTQAVIDNNPTTAESTYHKKLHVNVLFPQSSPQRPQPEAAAFIIFASPVSPNGGNLVTDPAYFHSNVIYADDYPYRNTVELYDVLNHELVYTTTAELFNTAFEHHTMTIDEVCTTFFDPDSPVYGEYFDKEQIGDTLAKAYYFGTADAEAVKTIAKFTGAQLNKERFDKIRQD